MSSILKALKKLEEDKVRSGETRVDIAADILRAPQKKTAGRKGMLGAVLVVLVGAGLCSWLVFDFKDPVPPRVAPQRQPVLSRRMASHSSGEPKKQQTVSQPEPVVTGQPPEQAHQGSDANQPESGGGGPVSAPVLTLTGIVYQADPSSRMAIINDLPVMVGGVVDGWTLEKIEADQIVVLRDGIRFGIRLENDGRTNTFRVQGATRPAE